MSTTPTPLSVEQTAELTKAIQASLNPEEIRLAVVAEAERQQAAKAEADKTAAETAAKKAADEKAATDAAAAAAAKAEAEKIYTRVEVIGGQEFTFEAATELELERAVSTAYRMYEALQDTLPARQQQESVQSSKTAEQEAAEQAELELKFKRGEVSAADYIEQSGVLSDYLQKQGISLEALKNASEAAVSQGEVLGWQAATDIFLKSPLGQDWPGGDKNLELMGLKLTEMGLMDADDKVGAFGKAWAAMKASGLYFPYQEGTPVYGQTIQTIADAQATAAAKAIADKAAADAAIAAHKAADAKAAAEAASRASAAPSQQYTGASALFGVSAGVAERVVGDAERGVAQQVQIPQDATPAQILEAWKQQQIANSKSPDAAFVETFAARRV